MSYITQLTILENLYTEFPFLALLRIAAIHQSTTTKIAKRKKRKSWFSILILSPFLVLDGGSLSNSNQPPPLSLTVLGWLHTAQRIYDKSRGKRGHIPLSLFLSRDSLSPELFLGGFECVFTGSCVRSLAGRHRVW